MKCSIIIVNWNGKHWLEQFLPAVVSSAGNDVEIIIADNASTDDGPAWVNAHFPNVRVLRFAHNFGYCGGNNRAAREATGQYLVFLNNDVLVEPGWLEPLIHALEKNSAIGAVQPKLHAFDNRDHFEYAGAAGGEIDRLGYPFCRGRVFEITEKDEGQFDGLSTPVFWASGAALVLSKKLFLQCGGFDEDFEFHMEEIDLCWQIQRRGFTIRCIPESVVYHVGGGSLTSDSPRKLHYNIRNNLVMLTKHLPFLRLILTLSIRLDLDLNMAVLEMLRGRKEHAGAIFSGYRDFFRQLKPVIRKRNAFLEDNIPFETKYMAPVFLPWEFYFRKRKTWLSIMRKHQKQANLSDIR